MKQVFEHYTKWEDYKNGMFEVSDIRDKHEKVISAINILRNENKFLEICNKIIEAWPVATSVNLTNLSTNRRAWLGAAACCFDAGTQEYLTRIAWNLLNKDEQDKANRIADLVICEYHQKTTQHAKTLFDN